MARELSERQDRLRWVAAPPAIWAAHFLLSYATVAVWCARYAPPGGSLASARIAVFAYTAVALVAVGGVALRGLRHYRSAGPVPSGHDSPEGRRRFIGFTLLALSGLTALSIVYEALAAVFIRSCH